MKILKYSKNFEYFWFFCLDEIILTRIMPEMEVKEMIATAKVA